MQLLAYNYVNHSCVKCYRLFLLAVVEMLMTTKKIHYHLVVPILRVIVLSCVVPYKFCTFDDDFNLAVGQFFINHQPKYRTLKVSYGNP